MEMPRTCWLAAAFSAFFCAKFVQADAVSDHLLQVQKLVDAGDYRSARTRIDELLQSDSPPQLRKPLAFEAERMRRIEMEFDLDATALQSAVRRYIPDASATEIRQWERQRLLEYKQIDGERRFFRRAAYNLMHVSAEALARNPRFTRFGAGADLYAAHNHHDRVIAADAPLRNRFQVTYTLAVEADAVPPGETVRAWIPYPQTLPGSQENVELLASQPAQYLLAAPQQPQSTIYLERQAAAGEPTEFRVSYRFDSLSRYTAIDPDIAALPGTSAALTPYLQQRPPHIVFSPELRTLSAKVVGDEKNPYRIAQKLFAYVDAIPWASAREYSTIRNISEYVANAGHADCGQKTLLLITLLRMNGIPARWQSGWEFSPDGFDTMHDWGEFYLEPYGWMPMDVTHGVLEGENPSLSWFYLGGLDAYRLIFNTDYSRPFRPEKAHFRSETVDSQRGEVEWRGGNLYFDRWDYTMEWQLLAADGGREEATENRE